MTRPLQLVLIGIGGYGNHYVNALLDRADGEDVRIVSAVDPSPDGCRRLNELTERGIPVRRDLAGLSSQQGIDLAIVSTPIHLHARHTCWALARGSHVLCEKPLCATLDEIDQMTAARDAARRQVAIGYQWSFSSAIQQVKRDILIGRFGKARRLRSLTLWPRGEAYYRRNHWAGVLRSTEGHWVLDSPVNNACAHHLHNMLYVLGAEPHLSAQPAEVTAELYRANPIETYDTAAFRIMTDDGVELLFYATHAVRDTRGPEFIFEFERAIIRYRQCDGGALQAELPDGETVVYGAPDEGRSRKLWLTMDCIENGIQVPCGIEAAAAHTLCVWAAQHSQPTVTAFPSGNVRLSGPPDNRQISVDGLDQVFIDCYERGVLPSELRVSWSKPGNPVCVDHLRQLVTTMTYPYYAGCMVNRRTE